MELLLRSDDEGVTTLTLNRPDRRNALTTDLLRALVEELDAIQDSPHVRAVVLTGADGTFCAGADLDELAGATDPNAGQRRIRLVTTAIARLRNLEQPTIAAVAGAAFGAGWGLSLACDLTYATTDATFCLPEVRKGLRLPAAITARLTEVVGPIRAADIALTGDTFTAEAGVAAGWVARAWPDDVSMVDRVTALTRALASQPRSRTSQVTQVLRRSSFQELTPPPEYGWNEE